jgi:hypothetical protein
MAQLMVTRCDKFKRVETIFFTVRGVVESAVLETQ